MYNVKLDENKYFTGSYAKVGRVQDGIDILTLPPLDDIQKALCFKYDYHDVTSIQSVPDIDGTTGLQKTDEQGNLIYIDQPITTSIKEWFFDEGKYHLWLEEELNRVPEPTQEEKINALQAENELLKGCIMELANVVYA